MFVYICRIVWSRHNWFTNDFTIRDDRTIAYRAKTRYATDILRDFNSRIAPWIETIEMKAISQSTLERATRLRKCRSQIYVSQFAGRGEVVSRNEDWKGDVASRDKTRESIRRSTACFAREFLGNLNDDNTFAGGLLWRAFRRGSRMRWGSNWGKPDPFPLLSPFSPSPLYTPGFPSSPPRSCYDEEPHGNVGRSVED